MSVKLCYRAALEELTGRREEYIEARAVSEALSHIKRRYSRAAYREARRMLIAVNGESIQLRGGFAAPLRDGDTLSFLPFRGGRRRRTRREQTS